MITPHPQEPPRPPHGELIETAREALGMSQRAAASRAGVARKTWIDTVRGHKKVGGRWQPIGSEPATIAHMAHAVSVPPDRLGTEGRSPDAARILREILRRQDGARPAPVPAPDPLPDDPALRQIMEDERLPLDVRRGMVALAEAMRRRSDSERDGEGESALRAVLPRRHQPQPTRLRLGLRPAEPPADAHRGQRLAVGAHLRLQGGDPELGFLVPPPFPGPRLPGPQGERAPGLRQGQRPREAPAQPVHVELFPDRRDRRPQCRDHRPQDVPEDRLHRSPSPFFRRAPPHP